MLMDFLFPDWLAHPHAAYVLAAYGAAAAVFGGLLLLSWRGLRRAETDRAERS